MDALKYESKFEKVVDYFFNLNSDLYDEVTFCIIYDTLCWK